MRNRARIGKIPGALAAIFLPAFGAGIVGEVFFLAKAAHAPTMSAAASARHSGLVIDLVLAAILTFASIATLLRMRGVLRGTPGRTRSTILASSTLFVVIACAAQTAILSSWSKSTANLDFQSLTTGLGDWMTTVSTGAPTWQWNIFVACIAIGSVSLLVAIAADISFWFLLKERTRRAVWNVIDVLLTITFIYVSNTYPITVPEGHRELVQPAAIRLAVSVFFGIRATSHILPRILDFVETWSVRNFVAARLLRAPKSGFLTAIGMLSIMAVSFSSCSLTAVLSVMGGFRSDLKRKIIGQNAHIVIDRDTGRIENWLPVIEIVRKTDGLRGASPYVSGEVMIASSMNRAGAVVRGIDLASISQVTDLARNMKAGKLEYLASPDKLLQEASPPPDFVGTQGSLLHDIDRAITHAAKNGAHDDDDSLDDLDFVDHKEAEPRTVLPGVVIGKELARSLRLYVGDEVNIVSPLGDIGPNGPIPKSRAFRVAGIFFSGMYEFDMKYAYVALPVAQAFLGAGQSINGIEIKVRDMDRAPQIADVIRANLHRDDVRVRDWQELNKNLFGALALEKVAMFTVLGTAILVASFCIFASLMLMVKEKAQQVGVLMAMGTPSSGIVQIFLLEGLFIGLIGAAIGLGIGYAVCFAAEHFGIWINPDVYYIDRLPVHVDPSEFAMVGLVAIAMSVLVTILPAVLASRLHPLEALRYE